MHVISCCCVVGKEDEDLLNEVAMHYIKGMKDMSGRAPGAATIRGKKKKKNFCFFMDFSSNQCFASYF